jgi:hypothetical protein
MMHRSTLVAVAFTFLAGGAMAQTTTAPNPAAPGTSTIAPSPTTSGGMTATTTGSVTVHYVTEKPADVLSSRLIGTDVYNKQNEKLGDVSDLIIENGKTVTGVVVSVGGFLGMGEHYVAIDPSSITLAKNNNDTWKAVVDTNKENLKNAPNFKYAKR